MLYYIVGLSNKSVHFVVALFIKQDMNNKRKRNNVNNVNCN